MATFTNQATLIYNGRATSSNVTTGELLNGVTIVKEAISSDYTSSGNVVYLVTLTNSGGAVTNATLTDDLGAYTTTGGTLYPLNYVTDSLRYYQNGAVATGATAVGGPPLIITGINIPAGGNTQLIYEAAVTEYAPFGIGATITNVATLTNYGIPEEISDTATVGARETALLTIAKAICPDTVTDNGTLTYTFIIQNSGNVDVSATDDLVVNDVFNPILNPITVTYNGTTWTEGVEYTYDEATGTFATLPGNITVPAATYNQDPTTGVITTTPGVAVITVTGTV